MNNIYKTGLLAVGLVICGSTPMVALAQDSAASANSEIIVTGPFQKLWATGNKTEQAGLAALSKSQGKLADANRDITNAADKQTNGSSNALNAANEFRQLTTADHEFSDSGEALSWAEKLKAVASRWKKSEHSANDGGSNMSKAVKRQKHAQEEIINAEAQIAKGRATMADAQRRTIGGS